MRPYRVQVIGGIVLHQGRIAEMKTGEGKTLVAILPAYLNALTGNGVHIVTVNDYLAKRDSEWMGKVYRFLGLTVGLIIHDLMPEQRRRAYAADITYCTNNELGFDYLRDNMTAADAAYSLNISRNSDYYGTRLSRVTSIVAQDDTTLVLTTDTAYECLPLLLDIPIIKDGSVQQTNPPGTGPYTLSGGALVRWDGWWQTTEPLVNFDTIALTESDTASDIRDNFEYGDADLVETDPNSLAYVGFHNDYELWNGTTTILQYIGYNLTAGAFTNYGLRAAVTYAVDRSSIVANDLGGFGTAAVLPCSPQTSYYDAKLAADYGFSLTNFYAQLNSAGVKDEDGDGVLDLYFDSLGYSIPVSGTMPG